MAGPGVLLRGAAPRLAGSIAVGSILLLGATVVFGLLPGEERVPESLSAEIGADDLILLTALLAFAGVGLLVSLRRPGNPIGWLLLVVGGSVPTHHRRR